MRLKTVVQKIAVPLALAVLTCCPPDLAGDKAPNGSNKANSELAASPFIRAGGKTRLKAPNGSNKANPELASKPAASPFIRAGGKTRLLDGAQVPAILERQQQEAVAERTPEAKAEPARHEGERGWKAPLWLWLATAAMAAVDFGLLVRQLLKVHKTKNTESFSKASTLLSLAGTALWTGYAICLKDPMLTVSNVLLLPCLYYLAHMKIRNRDKVEPLEPEERRNSRLSTAIGCALIALIAGVAFYCERKGLGIAATCLGASGFVLRRISPLIQTVKTVIDRSTASFDYWATVLSPVTTAIWVAYGLAQEEWLVAIANFMGFAAGCIIAYIMVGNKSKSKGA